jgi:hypothetical protein
MNWSLNTASKSSNSVQAHMNIIGDCINQIGQALTLSREAVRAYASKAMSWFSWGDTTDFLLVDRIIVMIKRLTHHLREMMRDMKSWWVYTQDFALVSAMNEHMASLETAQRRSTFLQRTFGWALQEPMQMMKKISEGYKI